MPSLFDYVKQTQRFIHDANQQLIDPQDLIEYCNRARREVAMRSMSVRVLTPITGQIINYSVTSNGSGYTNPSVTISPPDFASGQLPFPNGAQATASAIVTNGSITQINNLYGGQGYFQPQVIINDPTGTGAAATPQMSFINQLNQGQEVYPFSAINLSQFPGVSSVYMVKSLSIIYSNYRYSLPVYSFSTYQSQVRQYAPPGIYQYVPTFAAQFGRGTNGSLFLYPLPSQQYQFELDCFCLPSDLTTDQEYEAIPGPWTDSIPFLAAYYAFLEIQNFNYAIGYKKEFDEWMSRQSKYAQPGRVSNPYGRW
ncbi:MAG: hypothetical protein KGL39_49965 [Patescibacteria group bacterium]|nr:hypothetical protein [Patescibacteria group bacterium]